MKLAFNRTTRSCKAFHPAHDVLSMDSVAAAARQHPGRSIGQRLQGAMIAEATHSASDMPFSLPLSSFCLARIRFRRLSQPAHESRAALFARCRNIRAGYRSWHSGHSRSSTCSVAAPILWVTTFYRSHAACRWINGTHQQSTPRSAAEAFSIDKPPRCIYMARQDRDIV